MLEVVLEARLLVTSDPTRLRRIPNPFLHLREGNWLAISCQINWANRKFAVSKLRCDSSLKPLLLQRFENTRLRSVIRAALGGHVIVRLGCCMPLSRSANDEFFEKVERALRALFDLARQKNELHFAMALMPELRGMQDAGWNTAEEAHRAFDEYLEFVKNTGEGSIRRRAALAFYSHVAEASGFYEVPKNMLRIAGGESHVLWPFMHLVELHRITGERIAPNANKVIKDLAGHAQTLDLHELAEVFRDAFDSDVRNEYAHADYIIRDDGLLLRKRNGGHPKLIPWKDFSLIFDRGINFFHILRQVVKDYVQSYSQPRTIKARLQHEPERDWTIYLAPNGDFGITSGKYEPPAANYTDEPGSIQQGFR